jgi:hypothetical protein
VGLISNYIRFVCLASLVLGWISNGHAAATITFSQVGNDVQATITGSLDLTGLYRIAPSSPNARVRGGGTGANLIVGPEDQTVSDTYVSISGPKYIGCSTDTIDANLGSVAGPFGINMSLTRLIVPSNFTGGAVGTVNATWSGATIASLGLFSGTYVYTWAGDTLTIVIPSPGVSSCVPALSDGTQLLLALMTITLVGWHFHRERSY